MDLVRRVGLSPNVRKKHLPTKGKIFGVPLTELTEKCDNDENVPNIVYQLVNYIRLYGFQEEGLFRVSGNRRVIDQLRAEYDQYGRADLSNIQDVSVVTSIFKMFFRELPQPLISDEVSQGILLAAEDRSLSTTDLVNKLRSQCKSLPPINLNLLKYLCAFLNEVGQNVADTKMTDSSLAIVFGPNLFRIKNDLEALQRQPTITKAMSCMITNHQQIFSESEVIYSTVDKHQPPSPGGLIRVESANVNTTHISTPYFILPEHQDTTKALNNKENINTVANNKTKDWDDTWLSGLAHDSPSPETEDILARSHDSLSSMSPLTGSGNLSIQFNLQQTIKECIWEMLIPTPTTSDHSFSIYNNKNSGNDGRLSNGGEKLRRKGPKPDYHVNRNSCVAVDSIRTTSGNTDVRTNESERHPSPSPSPTAPPFDRRCSDGMFNFETCQPLTTITKGRASPQKRRQISKSRTQSASQSSSQGQGLVPKLNLMKLSKVESVSSLTCQSDVSSVPSVNVSPKTSPSTSNSIVSLNSKITLLKQQVVTFDTNFEKMHCRPPVGNERRPISSTIRELNELKRLLIDAKAVESSKIKSSLTNQYSMIHTKMEEKRKLAGRPHDLKLMSHAQLADEKLCIQKLLLHFEETYGRPKTKDQKDTMRPIYDRYRKVKVALNKKTDASPGGGGGDTTPTRANNHLGDTWNVTMGTTTSAVVSGMELINLTPEQLVEKMSELQESKRVLRKSLRDYEKSFLNKHGRKVLKEDRGPKEPEYNEYKKIKAKIRLVETLLKKNDGSQTI